MISHSGVRNLIEHEQGEKHQEICSTKCFLTFYFTLLFMYAVAAFNMMWWSLNLSSRWDATIPRASGKWLYKKLSYLLHYTLACLCCFHGRRGKSGHCQKWSWGWGMMTSPSEGKLLNLMQASNKHQEHGSIVLLYLHFYVIACLCWCHKGKRQCGLNLSKGWGAMISRLGG